MTTVIGNPLRVVTRLWWLYLAAGVLWIGFGMWMWSYPVGSLVALAVLIGVTMILNGVTEIAIGSVLPIFPWLLLLIGVLSIAGGVAMLAWPGPTLFVNAVFLSWFLVIMGTVHVIGAFARMGESYWWLRGVNGIFNASGLRRVAEVVKSATISV